MCKLELICEKCGMSFLRQRSNVQQTKRNFCSRKCFSETQKGINPFPGKSYEKKMMVMVSCSYCQQPIERWNYQIKKHEFSFCSPKCQGKWNAIHRLAEKSSNWKGGEYATIARQLSNNKWCKIRSQILELDDRKCALCSSDIKLEVHHIIEKGKNPALIYDMMNLITLCKKCHCRIRGIESDYVGLFSDIAENRVNCGKPRTGNPQPSRVETRKVQRLAEDGTPSLMTATSARHESDEIVQTL